MLIALIIATLLVQLLSLDSVEVIGDVNEISGALPLPMLPDLSLAGRVIDAAAAVAIIGLVQGPASARALPIRTANIPTRQGTLPDRGWPIP